MLGVRVNQEYYPGSPEPSVYYDPLVLVSLYEALQHGSDIAAINQLFDERPAPEDLIEPKLVS
jgi:hypothetical protein